MDRWEVARFSASAGCCCLFVACIAICSVALAETGPPTPAPTKRLDLSTVGYQELSAMARRSGQANLSLDFLDSDHVLFTFNPKKLFRRLPDCPPTHDDRLIHAAVLEVSTGKILKGTDWYLHDARRYLWPLGSGRVLLRKLNSLYSVGTDLQEKRLLASPKDLLWVSVTPDDKQIIVETPDDAAATDSKLKSTRVRIEFRDANSLVVQRVIRSQKPASLEATSSGFASAIAGFTGKIWLVRFGAGEQGRANLARVRTRRVPDVLYLSSNTLLIGRDSTLTPGYSVSAFTTTGNRLWQQHWSGHRYSPDLARSEDGSRFAISTLSVTDAPTPDTADDGPDSKQEGLEQRIQVLDTASGEPVLSVAATPVVLTGQNFSLSPDGRRLALLRRATIELYDLPQMSPDEQAKYTAVRADVPGLYVPPAETSRVDAVANAGVSAKSEIRDDAAFTSADSDSEPATKDQAASADPDPEGATSSATAVHGPSPSSLDLPAPLAANGLPSGDWVATFRSHAQVVALDVVVADPKGHTVKGIPRQDFLVKEDGKPQTVSYFDEVGKSQPIRAPSASGEPATPEKKEQPPNVFSNVSPSPESSAVTVILYDVLNTPAPEQQSAKQALLEFLRNKPKDVKFALCVLSETLQMVQGFTPDESLLLRAAKGQKGSLRYSSLLNQEAQDRQTVDWLTQGSIRLLARNSNFQTGARTMLDTAGRLEQEETQRRAQDLEMRMRLTMDAVTQLARYLSAIPGRKSLIWLSGSFPLGIFPEVDLRNRNSESYADQVKQAVNLLAEAHIALYPMDVRGLSVYAMQTSTFNNGPDLTQPSAASQSPFVASSDTKRFDELANLSAAGSIGSNLPGGSSPFMEEMTEHGIMDEIAADTGGQAFYKTNGIGQAMAVVMDQETNYYALSYSPANQKYDGKFRKIKVSLSASEKKLHPSYRSGYFAVDPDAQVNASKEAVSGFGLMAMQHGSPQSHQIFFAARVVPVGKPRRVKGVPVEGSAASRKKNKRASDPPATESVEVQRYAIDFAVTPSQLRFDTKPGGISHGVMNVMVTSFDDDGTARTSIANRALSDLTPENYQRVVAGGLRVHQEIDVPVKATWLRMGVQDALTGKMGTIEVPLPIAAPPGVEQGLVHSMPEIEPD